MCPGSKEGVTQPTDLKAGRGRCRPTARIVPHPCQNTPAQAVIGGHSGDIRRRGDLDSGRYWCCLNKPDKEEIIERVSNQLSNDRGER
jgi:hypothetical protein